MKQSLIEKARAAEQVALLFSQNSAVAALVVGSNAILQDVASLLTSIYATDTQIQGLNQLNVQPKSKVRAALEQKTFETSARTIGFAINTNNLVLEQQVTTTISALRNMPEFNLRDFAQMIHDSVNPIVATIDPVYRITAVDMLDLQTLINDFSALLPGAGNRIALIKQLNDSLSIAFDDKNALLKKLDKLVEMVRFDQAAFYKAYKSARVPKKVAVNKKSAVLTVVEKTTQTPRLKAIATFVNQKTQKVYTKSSTVNGTITFPSLPEAMYNLTVTEAGYTTYAETLKINDGYTHKATIELNAI